MTTSNNATFTLLSNEDYKALSAAQKRAYTKALKKEQASFLETTYNPSALLNGKQLPTQWDSKLWGNYAKAMKNGTTRQSCEVWTLGVFCKENNLELVIGNSVYDFKAIMEKIETKKVFKINDFKIFSTHFKILLNKIIKMDFAELKDDQKITKYNSLDEGLQVVSLLNYLQSIDGLFRPVKGEKKPTK